MDPKIKNAIEAAVKNESLARTFKIELVELNTGTSAVEMVYDPDMMSNIYDRAHGGAIFALIDEAFETACQTHGTISVALNVNVTYIVSPKDKTRLRAEAREVSRTKKTATYDIKVYGPDRTLIATCQALAFRTGKPIPFL
ncbi:PaaI family thioesterase [Thermodesulfobacteriota bacterium]